MRLCSTLIALLLLSAVSPALADTGPAGFSVPVPVGSDLVYAPTGSIGTSGHAALAWSVARNPPEGRATGDVVVVRGEPLTEAWGANEVVAQGADQVRDVQVAEGGAAGTVVAWTEMRDEHWRVLAANAPQGRPFGRPQVVAEVAIDLGARRRGYVSATQLVVTNFDDRFMLIWQEADPDGPRPGALRYALSPQGHGFGRTHSLTKSGASPALVATRDGGAVAAWRVSRLDRAGRARRIRLRAARLAPRAETFSPSYLISRSVAFGPRLASSPNSTVVLASWTSQRPYRLLTRRIPSLSRVQTLARIRRPVPAGAIAVGPKGNSIAAFGQFSTHPLVKATTSGVAGRWRAPESLTSPSPDKVIAGRLRAVISTSGDGLVAWVQSVDQPGPIAYEVVVARHPRGSAHFEAATRLGPGPPTTYGTDRTGVVLERGGGAILAAWSSPQPAGGMLVSTKPDP